MNSQPKEALTEPSASDLWRPYEADLVAAEAHLARNLTAGVPLVGEVARYVLGSGGKRFRPLLVAASSRLAGRTDAPHPADDPAALLGCVVEYIHTATLLHDDVVDDGRVRRGQDAARMVWGNAASVLVGDYLYARSLALAVGLGNIEVVRILTHAVEEMSQGEVMQLALCGDPTLIEADYLRIVELKTASLMGAACRVGGLVAGADEAQAGALDTFGRHVGIAFQVADDTLDYDADAQVFGKALGTDLRDGKITLPLLFALERCDGEERERVLHVLSLDDHPEDDDLAFVHDLLIRHDTLDASLDLARGYAAQAKQVLCAQFPDGPHRRALMALADYVVRRDR